MTPRPSLAEKLHITKHAHDRWRERVTPLVPGALLVDFVRTAKVRKRSGFGGWLRPGIVILRSSLLPGVEGVCESDTLLTVTVDPRRLRNASLAARDGSLAARSGSAV